MADFQSKWVPAGGAPFAFSGLYELDRDGVSDSGIQRRIPSAEAGGDGEWATDGLAEVRTVTIQGTMNASSADALRAARQALSAALASRAEGKLYIHSDRFLLCRVVRFDPDPESGWSYQTWRATFKASSAPFWQDDTETGTAAAAGTIAYPALGDLITPARLVVVVTATGAPAGTITFAHAEGSAILRPSAIGTYTVDGAEGTVTRGGLDAIADFEGSFPKVLGSGGNIAVSTLSGAAYSAATSYARGRFEAL